MASKQLVHDTVTSDSDAFIRLASDLEALRRNDGMKPSKVAELLLKITPEQLLEGRVEVNLINVMDPKERDQLKKPLDIVAYADYGMDGMESLTSAKQANNRGRGYHSDSLDRELTETKAAVALIKEAFENARSLDSKAKGQSMPTGVGSGGRMEERRQHLTK